jgi:glucokinase
VLVSPSISTKARSVLHDYGARLVGDIGGTNARFAWQATPRQGLDHIATYRCADFATLTEAITHYLTEHALPNPYAFALGVATPVTGDEIRMTNHHWSFSISTLRAKLSASDGIVINDFLALASAIPALDDDDVRKIGDATRVAGAPIALIGPGTGLGVACLFADANGNYRATPGEGGHVTLAARDDFEAAVIAALRAKLGHVSAERAISGPGLVVLYEAIAAVKGVNAERATPETITAQAMANTDPLCVETVHLFTSLLGNVAGNLALTVGAFGGVYVGGGIVPRLGNRFDDALFRRAFEAKGRFESYLARIPTSIITCQAPALTGAARYLDHYLANKN